MAAPLRNSSPRRRPQRLTTSGKLTLWTPRDSAIALLARLSTELTGLEMVVDQADMGKPIIEKGLGCGHDEIDESVSGNTDGSAEARGESVTPYGRPGATRVGIPFSRSAVAARRAFSSERMMSVARGR